MPFSPDYVRLVLSENFEDAKRLLLDPLMAIHEAHLVMLVETGIVSTADARAIRTALSRVDLSAVRRYTYDGSCEDLFFHVDRLLASDCGADTAGRLHTARSRNDIDMTMYRMQLREAVLGVLEATLKLRRALLLVASRNVETIFPAHTHTQPAQPTTIAHYLLALVEELERGATRCLAAFDRTNRNPLGACAITGTGFPIDRNRTSELLGFDGADRQHVRQHRHGRLPARGGCRGVDRGVGLGRFVQDMLLWCTAEVGYLRLPDGFVQVSSIMPQKRNPVALEHARSILSRGVAELAAITGDGAQHAVRRHRRHRGRSAAPRRVGVRQRDEGHRDGGRGDGRGHVRCGPDARARGRGMVTVTELADALARDHGLSFRVGHAVAAKVVALRRADTSVPLAPMVESLTGALGGAPVKLSEEALAEMLSPEHFVAVRRTFGGPAPDVVRQAIAASSATLSADEAALQAKRARSAAADAARRAALGAI